MIGTDSGYTSAFPSFELKDMDKYGPPPPHIYTVQPMPVLDEVTIISSSNVTDF